MRSVLTVCIRNDLSLFVNENKLRVSGADTDSAMVRVVVSASWDALLASGLAVNAPRTQVQIYPLKRLSQAIGSSAFNLQGAKRKCIGISAACCRGLRGDNAQFPTRPAPRSSDRVLTINLFLLGENIESPHLCPAQHPPLCWGPMRG